jgi:predicted RNase H-like nuclease (RuvC/YqgF family)
MEISIETIMSAIGLIFGGSGIGALIGWRYQKKKAKAEAKQAEAEAERAKYEAMQANAQLIKEIQTSYQQMTADLKTNLDTQQEYNAEQKQYIAELKDDRSHLRQERDDQRIQIERLTRTMSEWKNESDEKIRNLQIQVARNGRQIECMRPLLCGREGCAIRVPVTISESGEIDKTLRPQTCQSEVEPLKSEEL